MTEALVRSQQHNQSYVVSVEEGVAGPEKLDGIGGEEGEAGGFEDNGTTVWFLSCPLFILTVIT